MLTMRKNQKEDTKPNVMVYKMENSSNGLNDRLGSAEEKISNFENNTWEIVFEMTDKRENMEIN